IFLIPFNNTTTPDIYTLSLHDALPISSITTGTGTYTVTVTDSNGCTGTSPSVTVTNSNPQATINLPDTVCPGDYTILSVSPAFADRKSTRLNSSHVKISYAVFCLKKKK